MRIAEAMCRVNGCDFAGLERMFGLTRGRIENYSIAKPVTAGYSAYVKERREAKEELRHYKKTFFGKWVRR